MNIADEVIEAALDAALAVRRQPHDTTAGRHYLEVRAAVEAAAHLIAARAWDEGYEAGEDHGEWSAAPVREEPVHANPYKEARK